MYIEKTEDNSLIIYAKEANYEIFFHGEGEVVAEILKDKSKLRIDAEIYESSNPLYIKSLGVSITPEDTLETAFEKCNKSAIKLMEGLNKTEALVCSYTLDFLNKSNFLYLINEQNPVIYKDAENALNKLLEFKIEGFNEIKDHFRHFTSRYDLLEICYYEELSNLEILSELINEKISAETVSSPTFDFISSTDKYSNFVFENPFLIKFRPECLDKIPDTFYILNEWNESLLICDKERFWINGEEITKFNDNSKFTFEGIEYPKTREGLELLKIMNFDNNEIIIVDNMEVLKPEIKLENKNKLKI
jgi:hypothetical protein